MRTNSEQTTTKRSLSMNRYEQVDRRQGGSEEDDEDDDELIDP